MHLSLCSRQMQLIIELEQRDDNGDDCLLLIFSKKLLATEIRYSIDEKDCLAIQLATHFFETFHYSNWSLCFTVA